MVVMLRLKGMAVAPAIQHNYIEKESSLAEFRHSENIRTSSWNATTVFHEMFHKDEKKFRRSS